MNLRYLKIDKPEGYSQEELAKIQNEISSGNSDSNVSADNIDLTKKPNIIVIMNEAFSDLSVLGDYTTNTEVMPFISSLSENTQKGWMYLKMIFQTLRYYEPISVTGPRIRRLSVVMKRSLLTRGCLCLM